MVHLLPALIGLLAAPSPAAMPAERARWQAEAGRVTIVRDDWGIAHVHGRSDADAVFGMIYAQAEDDFNRIEANYLTALGRTAEAEGEKAIWADLRQKLFVDPAALKRDYAASAPWLRALMDSWADGLNFYLATHPRVKPRVITRFEPWMALSFSEGSIGGDIERIDLAALESFYGPRRLALAAPEPARFVEPKGSNGIAIAPANTIGHHALLLINPHTSFFFRSELQMTSDQGLNAYGAATWGQFFIYQGFNATAGWMHTSSGVDNVDEFAESIVRDGAQIRYRYGAAQRPVTVSTIVVPYRTAGGQMSERRFTVYRTHHGPIVREVGGKWIAAALMNRPVAALEQSFLRTKARDYASFLKVSARQANSSNDTLFADAKGEIAYLHPQFVPVRDARFDYRDPVDGADPATDWRGLTPLDALPHLRNPPSGWVYNANDEPWGAAGPGSIPRASFPAYMDQFGPNPRGEHATALLTGRRDFMPQSLIAAAYDSHMPTFARLVPLLAAAWDALPAGDPQRARLADPVALLRGWDDRWSATSEPTTLAVYWGEALWTALLPEVKRTRGSIWAAMAGSDSAAKLAALDAAVARLTADFGGWRVAWGQVNRFQRITGDIVQHFDDAGPSIAVPFTSAQWGSLASFGAKTYPGTKRRYGTNGNSFVAVVEFGPKVRAWAVSAGGESGDPASPHFTDQAGRYAAGDLRPVYFHPADLRQHIARSYHPGG